MKAQRLCISLALALGLLTLVGALMLLGAWGSRPPVAQAQSGTGVIRVATTGTDTPGCGSEASPCRTVQYAVDQAASDDEIHVAAGNYTGVQTRAGVVQTVYISKTVFLRGGYSADFSAWDSDVHVTTLNANGQGRVIYITGNVSPTVEGLRISGGDASGLGGSAIGDAGGGIYVISATATISGNVILNNVASTGDWSDGLGGGLYLRQSDALIVNNIITGNEAATSSWTGGWGGGLCAEEGAPTLRANQVMDNQAGRGGFFGNGAGGGLCFVESQPTLEANQIRENRATVTDDWGTGGGVEMLGCPDFSLINNVIADNVAPYGGGGLWIGHMSGVPSRGRLLHTTIARNQGGTGTAGVRVAGGSVVTMTNTILVGHDTGINVSFGCTATLTATLWGSGPWANDTDWGDVGTITTGTINIWGDPDFLNPDGGDYHIGAASDAVDAGVDAGIGTDMDGEPRDASPDIGADELGGWGLQVVKAASATDLYPGDTVTYTIAVTSGGTLGVTNVVLTDTLPALQHPLNVSPGCSIADPGYGGRVTCALGDLNAGHNAQVTLTAQVTTTVPPTLPQTMRNVALAVGDQAWSDGYADTILHAPGDCHVRINGGLPEYTTVQAAVDVATAGDEIWIAGTCEGAFERAGLFQQVYLNKSLTLQGGYSSDFSAWDPEAYPTTLDAGGEGRVVYVEAGNVTLEGLHLTGGDATGLGGTLFADAGGGLYVCSDATVTLYRAHVSGNVASTDYDGYGGGVGVVSATLTLVETTLSDNTASQATFGLGYGGGLSGEFSTIRMEGSRLEGNVGSGTLFGTGGGAYLFESDLEAEATLWLSNTVSALDWGQGGGLYVAGSRPFTLTNCVLADNRADDASGTSGSGIWVDGADGVLLHPTIARNQGNEGVSVNLTATVAITNGILVSHEVGIRAMEGSAVAVNGVLWHDNLNDTDTVNATVQVNNEVSGAPAFAPDGYHLTEGSAAIDEGVDAGVTTDIDAQDRPYNDKPDLGADEWHPPPCSRYDFDCDCDIDIVDIMAVASRWNCRCGDECYGALYDLDDDCDIDIVDIMAVASRWNCRCDDDCYYGPGSLAIKLREQKKAADQDV